MERAIVAVGTVAEETDRYRVVREGEGPRLLDEALSLGRQSRALHRRGTEETSDVMAIARGLDTIAARYRVLLDQVLASPEYRAVLAAYAGADYSVLARLIPAVFAEVEPVDDVPYGYYPVSVSAAGNRTVTPGALADRLVALCTGGITAADPGAAGTDGRLRAVMLQSDWRHLETPVALRLEPKAIAVPIFRLGSSAALLIYTELLAVNDFTTTPTIVLARAAGPDRWPETGVDYTEFRIALASALDESRYPHTLLDG